MATVLGEGEPVIRTPDQRLRVFVSSTLSELAEERAAVRAAIERLHLVPVMFELGARPHPPRELYRAYLAQSHVFVGIYWQRYGWVAPGEEVSGLEDEYRLAGQLPQLMYLKAPSPDRETRLQSLLDRLTSDDRASYRVFTTAEELTGLLEDDLAVLLTERFEMARLPARSSAGVRLASTPPVPLTATVGRDAELATLTDLVADQRVRLVTLTGPGGIGKTRLSLEIARRVADAFPDGVHHVPLESLTDASLVLRAVADRLGASGEALCSVHDVLVHHLADRQLLLVIDNAEHVIEAAPQLGAVLDACPAVQAVVTSRQPLRLRGEHEFPVPPLNVPDPGPSLEVTSGIELFVQRARAVRPEFNVTEQNLPAVAELVRRLDGLPLAIELAAARTRLLPPDVLLKRLEQRLDVLAGGAVDLPERQRTLRATIDWSYHLLDPVEQQLLDRLSVFAGGPDLTAVEAICSEVGVDVLEVLSSLLEKSLLVSVASSEGEPRVQLLFTVRAYASAQLAARGETATMADRHADWFLARAALLDPARDPGAHGRFDPMLAETDDIRTAMGWVVDQGDAHRAARFAASTWMWFWLTGRVGDVRGWFERASALGDDPHAAAGDRGRLHYPWVMVLVFVGEYERAVEMLPQTIAVLDEVGDQVGAAWARIGLAAALPHLARAAEVDVHARDALAIGESIGEPYLIGYASSLIGTAATGSGDLPAARTALMRQLDAARRLGFRTLEAQALAQLGLVDVLDGHLDLAWPRMREAGDALEVTRNREVLSYWFDSAAPALLSEGDPAMALRVLLAAEDLRFQLGLVTWPLMVPLHTAALTEAAGMLGTRADAVPRERPTDAWLLMSDVLAAHPAPATVP
jgi:predicted ATPase